MDSPVQPTGQPPALLEQLRDIRMPEPASWWPPAPGWWIVAALVLAGAFLVVRALRRRSLEKYYRKEAQRLLDDLYASWQGDEDDRAFASGAHQLVRRIVIHHIGREGVARLTGQAFIDRANSLSAAMLSERTSSLLTEHGYRPDAAANADFDIAQARREIEAWLERLARPRRD
jgi:hypothetical protein